MKLIFPLLSVLFLSLCSCGSSNEFNKKTNKKAIKLLSFHLKNINYYVDNDSTTEWTSDIDKSIEFYESISLVKSYSKYQIDVLSPFPLKYNISEWTEFYNLNKNNVYLDKNKAIKFKDSPIYLEKDPVDYLDSFIKELDVMMLEKNISAEEFEYILEKLVIVTKLECSGNDYDFEKINNCIIVWKNWIKENSSKLYWNKGTQEVLVKY